MAEQPAPDDRKLVVLARASRARAQSAAGAAVRDRDGRTYSAADVELPSVRIGALELAVAMAVSSGATGLEAAAVVVDGTAPELDAVRDLGGQGLPVYVADTSAQVREVLHT